MSAGTGAAPGQAPPDLPSLLLDGRICYIGMPVTPYADFVHASPSLCNAATFAIVSCYHLPIF